MKNLLPIIITSTILLTSGCTTGKKNEYVSNVKSLIFYEGYPINVIGESLIKINAAISDSIITKHKKDSLAKGKMSLMELVKDSDYFNNMSCEYPLFKILHLNIEHSGHFPNSIILGTIYTKDTNTLNQYFRRRSLIKLLPADFQYKYVDFGFTESFRWVIGLKRSKPIVLGQRSVKSLQFIKHNTFRGILPYIINKIDGDNYVPLILLSDNYRNYLHVEHPYLVELKFKNYNVYQALNNRLSSDSIFFYKPFKETEFK